MTTSFRWCYVLAHTGERLTQRPRGHVVEPQRAHFLYRVIVGPPGLNAEISIAEAVLAEHPHGGAHGSPSFDRAESVQILHHRQTGPDHQMVRVQVHVAERHLSDAEFTQATLQADDVLSPIEVAVHYESLRIGTRQFV